MSGCIKVCGITLLLMGLLAPGALGASAEEVEEALRRAKAYLYSEQRNGHWDREAKPSPDEGRPWDVTGGQWGGNTAIAVYALLAAGEDPHDPRLAPAIEFLKTAEISGTYALALRMQVWLLLPQTPQIKQLMSRDAEALLTRVKSEGAARGFFDYLPTGPGGNYSHSRSQYGVLGIWAAEQAGIEIPPLFWQEVEQAWIRHQDPSGGWTYTKPGTEPNHPLTVGMTAAGVATLFITSDYLYAHQPGWRGSTYHPAIEKGLQWISEHFHLVATDELYPRDYPYVTLYSIERIGVASGLKHFNGIDWYQKGAEWLVRVQNRDGSWSGGRSSTSTLSSTAFGMLFLTKGRAPVVFNKLNYGTAARPQVSWNQRPRDVANMTRWLGRTFERDLNWQILFIETASLSDLLDAPILYISGNQPLQLSEAHKAKLRQYVEHGGLILGHADGGSGGFSNSFRRLGMELFPGNEFRTVSTDHPIYTLHFSHERWRGRPNVLGLSNGARELMLLIPQGDPSRAWHANQRGPRDEMYWELLANIVLYSIDREYLRFKDQGFLVEADEEITPDRTIRLARLEYEGNWNPEPGGWRRLANQMHNDRRVKLEVKEVKLGEGALKDVEVAHLTGTTPCRLSEAAREEVRQFVQGGGTLIVDAAGGLPEFAHSAEDELRSIFPEGELKQLPVDHAVYSSGGEPLREFGYRAFAQDTVVGQSRAPRVQGMEIGGRVAVFYSREDLSVGLVGQPVAGIVGYDPETASAVMERMLLYAGGR